jgi:hypothetical protein
MVQNSPAAGWRVFDQMFNAASVSEFRTGCKQFCSRLSAYRGRER